MTVEALAHIYCQQIFVYQSLFCFFLLLLLFVGLDDLNPICFILSRNVSVRAATGSRSGSTGSGGCGGGGGGGDEQYGDSTRM